MRRSMFALLAVLAAGLVTVSGCSPRKDVTKPIIKKADHDHAETGPHGGALVEWDEYHLEFTVDHGKKEATVYVLDEKVDKASPIAGEEMVLVLTHDKKPIEVPIKPSPEPSDPKGTASKYVAAHDELAKEIEFRGTIRGKIGGKAYEGEFVEEKDHKHEKKSK